MEIKDIINLVNAGYTRAEIEAMQKAAAAPAAQPAAAPAAQPAAAPAAQPAAAPAAQPAAAPAAQPADIAAQIAALTAAIQANGILNSSQPKQETADDILASLLDPNFNK